MANGGVTSRVRESRSTTGTAQPYRRRATSSRIAHTSSSEMLSEYAAWNSGAAMKLHVKMTAAPAANRPAVRSTRAYIKTIAAPPATRFTTVADKAKLSPVRAIIAPTTAGNTGGKANAQSAALASESPGEGRWYPMVAMRSYHWPSQLVINPR